jgi:hypothetical protein
VNGVRFCVPQSNWADVDWPPLNHLPRDGFGFELTVSQLASSQPFVAGRNIKGEPMPIIGSVTGVEKRGGAIGKDHPLRRVAQSPSAILERLDNNLIAVYESSARKHWQVWQQMGTDKPAAWVMRHRWSRYAHLPISAEWSLRNQGKCLDAASVRFLKKAIRSISDLTSPTSPASQSWTPPY